MTQTTKFYNISDLKVINPIYFGKGNDRSFGVKGRKLYNSPKLNCQVMVEKQKNTFGGVEMTQYTVREIDANGKICLPERFNNIYAAADYIGKNIIF